MIFSPGIYTCVTRVLCLFKIVTNSLISLSRVLNDVRIDQRVKFPAGVKLLPNRVQSTSSHPASLRYSLMLSTLSVHPRLGPPSGLFHARLQPNCCSYFSYPHARCVPCTFHSPLFVQPNIISWRVQLMKLPVVQFSPASWHFIPLGFRYSPKQPFLNTLNLCSSFKIRDRVSDLCKTSKIIVLPIYNVNLFRQQEGVQTAVNCAVAYVFLI
jgi:hypothetical protein